MATNIPDNYVTDEQRTLSEKSLTILGYSVARVDWKDDDEWLGEDQTEWLAENEDLHSVRLYGGSLTFTQALLILKDRGVEYDLAKRAYRHMKNGFVFECEPNDLTSILMALNKVLEYEQQSGECLQSL